MCSKDAGSPIAKKLVGPCSRNYRVMKLLYIYLSVFQKPYIDYIILVPNLDIFSTSVVYILKNIYSISSIFYRSTLTTMSRYLRKWLVFKITSLLIVNFY